MLSDYAAWVLTARCLVDCGTSGAGSRRTGSVLLVSRYQMRRGRAGTLAVDDASMFELFIERCGAAQSVEMIEMHS